MITGINHITLSVKNLPAAVRFYHEVLGCRLLCAWPRGAYLLAGETWLALVVDERTREGALPEYSHIAFSVEPGAFAELSARIKQSGALVWQENWTEGESLYFVDPDGHKLEIHASDLQSRLRTARERPWEGLEFIDEAPPTG